MHNILVWLGEAPSGAITLLAATVAAVVALLVTCITQWILGRRARTELLTKKLEDLYLVLNEAATHNLNRLDATLPLFVATPLNRVHITGSDLWHEGLNLQKKMTMFVRLYFPDLEDSYSKVAGKNKLVNTFIQDLEQGPPQSDNEFMQLAGKYGDSLVSMEKELIRNRRILVKDQIILRRYQREA